HKLVLSDGTQVWLNAQTTLTYPVSFTGKERVVKLTGEAYFEVAHDGTKPFKVVSNGQEVQVLGTSFDIKAYADEPVVQTTLLTGSVKLSASNNYVLLKPGQQAVLENNKDFSVNEVEPSESIAWKNGYFLFKNEGIESVMRTIARWYNVDVSYEGDVKKRRLGGTVSRYQNLDDLLKTIELTKSVKFKIEGRKVICTIY
ncbi:MAG TPA: FecR domain-containing protein, partial [Puia sp.]